MNTNLCKFTWRGIKGNYYGKRKKNAYPESKRIMIKLVATGRVSNAQPPEAGLISKHTRSTSPLPLRAHNVKMGN